MRQERDFLGTVELGDDFLFGIHTFRAMQNFAFTAEKVRSDIFTALVEVKKSAALANREADLLDSTKTEAIVSACDEILANPESFCPSLHPLQGGAGTSTNMAANELVANLALKKMGRPLGDYSEISPLGHVNLSQSTNDVYPTAVRIAVIRMLRQVHRQVENLLKVLLEKEKEFAHLLKVGRTELQDAMPLSLGQEFSAWAEAMTRFRWRLNKAADWIREINLGGTAVGTGINADPEYRAAVINILRRQIREPLAQARNLVDATQNTDQIVEVSGLIRTGAVALKKMCSDLRLLSSGPNCGFGEIRMPALQAGSSIMPGKVNPVMLEAAEQVCLAVMGGDSIIAAAAAESNLELPQFMPLIAHQLLSQMELFAGVIKGLCRTVALIESNPGRMKSHVENSFAVATLLAPYLGHGVMDEIVRAAVSEKRNLVEMIREKKLIDPGLLEKLITPGVMASPGMALLDEEER